MVRFVFMAAITAAASVSLAAQSPQGPPVVTLALRASLLQAVAEARAAIDRVDVKSVSVEAAGGARVEASAERARQAQHLIATAAEFARQNPDSMSAQLILLLQLDGFQAQVDGVAVNLEAASARASAADAARLGGWADQVGTALDELFKVRRALEPVVTAMVTDGERRLRDCGK